jgi:hypothetical protein
MSKFESGFDIGRQDPQERVQSFNILLHVWRQLKQHNAMILQRGHGVEHKLRWFCCFVESFEVSNPLRRFYREAKVSGTPGPPTFNHFSLRHAVKVLFSSTVLRRSA